VWPQEKRPRDEAGRFGSLHAKCAIADEEWLLVSSANLTMYAMNLNMELGLMIRGGNLPRITNRHFNNLIASETVRRIS
jgi:phosphatidylserine/phosphatidylglycerophosphate/cardiolipin synthase-like enzyme